MILQNKNSSKFGESGFTLVELIITLGLFIIIFTVVIGIFVRAITTSRYVGSITALNNNLSLVIEQISREVRTAYDFCVDLICDSANFSFRNSAGALVEYRLGTGEDAGRLIRASGGSGAPITAEDIEIAVLNFVVYTASSLQQPRVTVALTARHRDEVLQSVIAPIEIQTTISSRNPR